MSICMQREKCNKRVCRTQQGADAEAESIWILNARPRRPTATMPLRWCDPGVRGSVDDRAECLL